MTVGGKFSNSTKKSILIFRTGRCRGGCLSTGGFIWGDEGILTDVLLKALKMKTRYCNCLWFLNSTFGSTCLLGVWRNTIVNATTGMQSLKRTKFKLKTMVRLWRLETKFKLQMFITTRLSSSLQIPRRCSLYTNGLNGMLTMTSHTIYRMNTSILLLLGLTNQSNL